VDPLLGTVQWAAFDFVPDGWAPCDGSLLPIAQDVALFSLIGTLYGGDGRTTFALPDLRSATPVGTALPAAPPGLPPYYTGQTGTLAGGATPAAGTLAMTAIIAIVGVFPSRQ